ncbi:MAG: transposase [Lachnospiraceae bacterium]|nr:transposase [Lachnospiraceae bacterium]
MMESDPVAYALLLEKVYKGETVKCPKCGKEGLQHSFFSPKDDRVGFAQFHCKYCDTSSHLSRVRFPDGIETEEMY